MHHMCKILCTFELEDITMRQQAHKFVNVDNETEQRGFNKNLCSCDHIDEVNRLYSSDIIMNGTYLC